MALSASKIALLLLKELINHSKWYDVGDIN
jgi:hypothetical protein